MLNNNKENYGIISFQMDHKEIFYTKKKYLNIFQSMILIHVTIFNM